MSVLWLINGMPAAELGVTVTSGSERTAGVSTMSFEVSKNFDVPFSLAYQQQVVLARFDPATGTGQQIFQGKIAHPSKRASGDAESHGYLVEDAWADLETTIYQEDWKIGNGSYKLPKAVLGLRTNGDRVTIGGQMSEVIDYAISVGVGLQRGYIPDGEILWTEEIANMSCAEVLNKCLQYHPDWVPWINHATNPPTFNVTPVAQMATSVISTSGSDDLSSFRFTERDDLVPRSVRIVWEWAVTLEDNTGEPQVYRNAEIQKFPTGGPDGGPRVISLTLPLEGQTMQIQKQRVKVRKMPNTGDDGDAAKLWVKKQYLHLKNVPISEFEITSFTKTLVIEDEDDEDEAHPEPISAQAQRLIADDIGDVPNQLVAGQLEDWMRKKTGLVSFEVQLAPKSNASLATRTALAKGTLPGQMVCTNAVTKLYKGITQWAPPTEIPSGIAQGIFESASNAYRYEGTATLKNTEMGAYRYLGTRLVLAGTDMTGAPVNSVTWDVDTGETVIEFGPVPELAPADFLELQRRMRARPVTWWSKQERDSNQLGAQSRPSARGDTVGGYDTPGTTFEHGDNGKTYKKEAPLSLVKDRPAYIPAPSGSTPDEDRRYYLTMGLTNGLRADNWDTPVDLPASGTKYLAMKIYTAGETGYSRCEWVILDTMAELEAPRWPVSGRPAHFLILLAVLATKDGEPDIIHEGGGSIRLYQTLTGLDSAGDNFQSVYTYTMIYYRLAY